MRIGCISDIHGNFPALQAVLAAMPPVDRLVCAGDIVGYYPDVNEVCDMIRDKKIMVIRGNHDAYVLGDLIPAAGRKMLYRTDWTKESLSEENLAWLATLSKEILIQEDGVDLFIRHASPWDEETYLYPDSPLLEKVELRDDSIFLYGHTHYPLIKSTRDGLIVNPGSVGQPRDGNPSAAFCVLNTGNLQAQLLRSDYDVSEYQDRLRKLGWEEPTIAILSRRKS